MFNEANGTRHLELAQALSTPDIRFRHTPHHTLLIVLCLEEATFSALNNATFIKLRRPDSPKRISKVKTTCSAQITMHRSQNIASPMPATDSMPRQSMQLIIKKQPLGFIYRNNRLQFLHPQLDWIEKAQNMARPKRAEINDVNRRNELIATAAKLFKEKGFHATTTRDIAKASNMQAGSPFYHFATKQELLFVGIESSLLDCLSGLKAIAAASLSPLDYFRALTRLHLGRLLDTNSGIVPMVVDEWRHLEGDHREQVIAIRKQFDLLWRQAFVRLKEADLVSRADTLAVAYFLSALHGVVHWYRPDGHLSSDEIADDLVSWVTGDCPITPT